MRTAKKVTVGSGIAFVFLTGILLVQLVSAEEEIIPSWIKNTAKFWANDQVNDREFISALEFLINNNILKVPEMELLKSQLARLQLENEKLLEENTALKNQLTKQTAPTMSNIVSTKLTEDQIVSKVNNVSFLDKYSYLRDRLASEEDGNVNVLYRIYDDKRNNDVGILLISKKDQEVFKVAVSVPFEMNKESIFVAIQTLGSVQNKLITFEEWEKYSDTSFLLWVVDSFDKKLETNNIKIGTKNVNLVINQEKKVVYFVIEY